MNKNFITGGVILGGVLVIGGLLTALSLTTISPGYTGLLYDRSGGLEKETLGQGWHFVSPMKKVIEYPISTEIVTLEGESAFQVLTKDSKNVTVEPAYSYSMEVDKLSTVFSKFRGANVETIEEGFIRQTLKNSIQKVTSKYSVFDVMGEKVGEITPQVLEEMREQLSPVGIKIETLSFNRVTTDEKTMESIQKKVDAIQLLETMKVQKEQAVVAAEKARIEAQGNADKAVIEAKGRSQANSLLQQSITPELIEYEKAKKWDGKLPQVTGGNGTILSLPVK